VSAPDHRQNELVIEDRHISLDADGYLSNSEQWSPAVAEALADLDGIQLEPGHWWLIEFVRSHHHQYGTAPLMRVVVAALRAANADPTLGSRDVYRLFADNPVRQACKYAGLKKPDWCI
jgi:TusE/DsrC/DsvC family sulfur relay protein